VLLIRVGGFENTAAIDVAEQLVSRTILELVPIGHACLRLMVMGRFLRNGRQGFGDSVGPTASRARARPEKNIS
jgi:hypothetical protein